MAPTTLEQGGAAGLSGLPGAVEPAGPQGSQGPAGADAPQPEFIIEEGMIAWRLAGEGDDSWQILGPVTTQGRTPDPTAMIMPTARGWEVVPLFTVGERVGNYQPRES